MRITTIIGLHPQALGSLKLYEAKTDMVFFFSGSPPNPSSCTLLLVLQNAAKCRKNAVFWTFLYTAPTNMEALT